MARSSFEKHIHLAFEISIILKGIHAVIEIIGGVTLFFISQQVIAELIYSMTQEELLEDPHDAFIHYLVTSANHFTASSQDFAAWYLLSHGIVKGFLVINLWRKKLWAFPLAFVILGFFIAYQLYRYSYTHSVWLIVLTVLDLIIIWLSWREYKQRKVALGMK